MLRFRLGTIPVSVHFSHLLISVLFAWTFAQTGAVSEVWPGPQLRNPDEVFLYAAIVATWTVLILLSVLVHELGHALAARTFGYSPSIHLVGMGGLTQPNAPEEIPWLRDVALTLAGPAFGLSLTLLCGGLWATMQMTGAHHAPTEYLLSNLALVNGFWTFLNLVPVMPLDGGHLAAVLLVHFFQRSGFLIAQLLALGSALVLVVGGLFLNLPMVSMLFAIYGFRAMTLLLAWRRGEVPLGGGAAAAHPLSLAMEQAEQLYRDGKLDQAGARAQEILERAPPPLLRSRAHLLLGWLAVKRSQGREALDQFARVQGLAVPPVALAAAYSLAGDDARAVAYWEQAAARSADPVVWHELAGTLLRLGRESDVKRIPNIRPALAWAAAQRVHFLRAEYAQAAHAAESAFREEPSASSAYDAACAWAKAGDATSAMRMLKLAAQNGYDRQDDAATDPDLVSLRELPEFRQWLASLRPAST